MHCVLLLLCFSLCLFAYIKPRFLLFLVCRIQYTYTRNAIFKQVEELARLNTKEIMINNLRNSNDTAQIAENELQDLLDHVNFNSAECGLYFNIEKNKVMITGLEK